ncbi:Non-heme bromoperoxidase BPO-A2 [Thalassocella blandensis]|nr:Non-heme bromoperoxidase BPO-A2 [Thalassocella blandensis]
MKHAIQKRSFLTLIKTLSFLALYALCVSKVSAAEKPLVYDAELSTFEYPFAVQTYELSSQRQKLSMRYMDVGKANASKTPQKTAVLLHGKNFSGYYWEDVARLLLEHGYRVIIPDQIGFGKSSKPEHYQYSFAQLALNTQSLLQHIGINQYTVIGHSMGGMLATTLALNDAQVSDLMLINPIGLEPYLDYVEIKDPEFFYQSELKKTADKVRAYQKANYYDGKWKPEYERLIAPHIGWLNGPDKSLIAWNNALTYLPIFAEDITSKFSKITVPTQLIIGTRDRTGPGRNWKKSGVEHQLGQYQKLGKLTAKSITNAKLYELEGLGHMPQIEDFDRFKPVFLKALALEQ